MRLKILKIAILKINPFSEINVGNNFIFKFKLKINFLDFYFYFIILINNYLFSIYFSYFSK